MDCRQTTQYLDGLLDGTLSEPLRSVLRSHLGHCTACRRAMTQVQAFRTRLRDWPVPPPTPGFPDRVLHNAALRNRAWPAPRALIGLALAASLMAGIGVGLALAPLHAGRNAAVQSVAMNVEQPRSVQLAFESVHELRGVTLRLNLPPDVEVVGYPGQRQLVWRTDLKPGRNRLMLPLIAHAGPGGNLVAQMTQGARSKAFTVRIDVQQRRNAALPAGSLMG